MNVVLGAGLAGLTAAFTLKDAILLEKSPQAGGLAKTLSHGQCRFDIGGHRFITDLPEIQKLVETLIGSELLRVKRKSCILLKNGKKVPYPLKAGQSLKAVGLSSATLAVIDYIYHKAIASLKRKPLQTLEEWTIANFGKTLYLTYFKEYSEKVWGLSPQEISSEWISKRIQNLNLRQLINSVFFGSNKRTLTETFLYPRMGIGQIAESLCQCLGNLYYNARILEIKHNNKHIQSITFCCEGSIHTIPVKWLISTIPIDCLLKYLDGPDIALKYRDLLLVVPIFETDKLTQETWIYVPDREIPFGRVHEPKNWSPWMAPKDITHLVVEHFCSRGSWLWNQSDTALVAETIKYLKLLSLIEPQMKPIDAIVVRIPNAYPLFSRNYKEQLARAKCFLQKFDNLVLAGRTGAFLYLNMDEAMASGLEAAKHIMSYNDNASMCSYNTTVAT